MLMQVKLLQDKLSNLECTRQAVQKELQEALAIVNAATTEMVKARDDLKQKIDKRYFQN